MSDDNGVSDAIVGAILAEAARKPDKPALIYGSKSIAYGTLAEKIRSAAGFLRRSGVEPGERVILSATNAGPSFVYGYFGCHLVGAIAVPVEARIAQPTLAAIIVQTQPRLICLGSEGGAVSGSVPLESLDCAERWTGTAGERDPDETADILFTSGTTGRPKGVMQTRRGIFTFAANRNAVIGPDAAEGRLVLPLPLSHGVGLGRLRCTMLAGGTLIIVDGFLFPGDIFRAFDEHIATAFCGVPSGYAALFQLTGDKLGEYRDQLRYLESAAAPLPEADKRRLIRLLPNTRLFNMYGMTETTSTTTYIELHSSADKPSSVGRAMSGVEIRIIDNDRRPLPEGESGRIAIRGANVMKGYWKEPEKTAAALVDGWLLTNDIGFKDAAGFLYITGREEERINVGGLKVAPAEVESALREHPAIADCACVGEADPVGLSGELVRAFVIAAQGQPQPSADQLISFLRGQLESYKIPSEIIWVDALPKSSMGKIQRTRLKELEPGMRKTLLMAVPERRAALLASLVAGHVAAVAHLPPGSVNEHSSLGSLGLTSLMALELHSRLEAGLGTTLPATLLWGGHSTVGNLAAYLAREAGVGVPEAIPAEDAAIVRLIDGLSPRQRELLLERLGASSGDRAHEHIAVVGMAARFPGASNVDAFGALLREGRDAITEVPRDRWDAAAYYDPDQAAPGKMVSRWGGFLECVDLFDAEFFGISPREAARMDPQQRLLLETAWEAVEDAGVTMEALSGIGTGVFIGVQNFDYGLLSFARIDELDTYTHTGNMIAAGAGRLAYFLDLRGPTMTVDTTCSSSLVALHLAVQSLRRSECGQALVGGVNLILSPLPPIAFSKSGALAPDGRCKTFDARANGMVRSEGCGVMVLKRLSDALAAGDSIHAVIRGSAINHDGRGSGFTAPNRQAQEEVYKKALADAGIAASAVEFVETHGTGTSLGDPIEVESLAAVYGAPRTDGRSCALGAVKTNIGHTLSAAGMAGFIKTVLCLKHEAIPPNLNFLSLNPHISLDETSLILPTKLLPWPRRDERRRAAVSAFGMSGTNAHVILEEAPPPTSAADGRELSRPMLLPLSARSPEALRDIAAAYTRFVRAQGESAAMRDVCFTAGVRRSRHEHRLSVAFNSRDELLRLLDAYGRGERLPGVAAAHVPSALRPRLAFVFTGQGVQWWGMGRQLLETEPVYRSMIEDCDRILRVHAPWSLLEELTADESKSRMDDTGIAQPALFAFQAGLAALWRSWGLEPEGAIGHSVGEIAAAYTSGVLTLEDALRVAYHRGQAMRRGAGLGRMAAVALSSAEAEEATRSSHGRLSIAAVNGPRSAVISGSGSDLEAVVRRLESQGVFARMLKVNYAFHSGQMQPFAEEVEQVLKGLEPAAPKTALFSTVRGARSRAGDYGPAYWGRNVLQGVLFADALGAMIDEGYNAFLELGPHPALSADVADCLHDRARAGVVVASLRRKEDDRTSLMKSLAELSAAADLPGPAFFGSGRPVRLPSYPWRRERHWLDAQHPEEARPDQDLKTVLGHEADPAKRRPLLEAYIRGVVGGILGHPPERLDAGRSLVRLGMDSLTAVQLKANLDSELGVSLPVVEMLRGLNIAQLSAELDRKLRAPSI